MTTLAEARSLALRLGRSRPWGAERVPLADAVGRTLCEPVVALAAVPSTDVSAMDGWAVAGNGPWTIEGTVLMGEEPGEPLAPGSARGITTGGVVPWGTTAVLRSERGAVAGRTLVADPPPEAAADIRRAGEELRADDVVVPGGARVTPAVLAAAAAAGHDELCVRRSATAVLVCLGDEVVTEGVPRAGQVRDAFGVPLRALLRAEGVRVLRVDHVRDDRDAVSAALRSAAASADLIVTTGGTARGRGDHLVGAVEALGGVVHARGIAMRPGRPTVLASVDGVPVVGLPGNPFAAAAALVVVGLPVVAGLLGAEPRRPVPRVVAGPLAGSGSGVRVLAVRETDVGIVPSGRQDSGMATALIGADALALVDPPGARRGDVVPVVPLPWR